MSIVRSRYHRELEERQGLLKWGWYKWEAGLNPPRYYVPFDPTEDTKKDIDQFVNAINEKEGRTPKGGRRADDDLLPVMCAALLEKRAWSPELLADKLRISAKRVRELAKEGQALR